MIGSIRSTLPVSKPADWGFKVSVCIAALCEKRRIIVAAADMLATLGGFASDISVVKNDVLYPRWAVLTAGDDTEHIDPILTRARELLSRQYLHKTPQQVADKLSQAYEEQFQKQITAKILSRYRFTATSFRDSGKKKMTASVYNSIAAKIAAERLRLSFLVCGQGKDGVGHILGLHEGDAPVSYDKLGFWAIGSGSQMALASLSFRNRNSQISGMASLGECVYQVSAAKFMAESNGNVGRQTFFAVYGPNDGQVRFLFPSDQEKIRVAWEKEGAPRIPTKIVDEIPTMLYSQRDENFEQKSQQSQRECIDMLLTRRPVFER